MLSRMVRRVVVFPLLLLLLVTAPACGGASSPPAAERQVESAPVDGDEVVDPVAALVDVTALWQCDRARHTFDSLDEIETLRVATLEAAGITVEAHDAFLEDLEGDAALRARVRDAFVAECR